MRFFEDSIETLRCSDAVNRDIHIWQPEKPKAVFVAIHGGMAHGGDFVTPALYFKERGYATVSFDMHGHDKQKKVFVPRFETFLDDLKLFIDWVKTHYPELPLILLGHSMGGLILTHYGLRRIQQPDPRISGFVFSSPYFENAIPVHPILKKLSGLLSMVLPKISIPIKDFTDELTHDTAITERHKKDEADHIRASEVTARFGSELLKAQAFAQKRIAEWQHPLLVFIAGQDRLADSRVTTKMLQKIDPELVTAHTYPNNYHENFNETNREEIFGVIEEWIKNNL